ncbi:alpha/beta fold hydrolase [Nocardia brasiliensis]|uniref:alpha/beta fold hydrolase n=1 Tax=Nocardia brasiliensis TaxID=37326 RepID=UPI003D905665
MGRELYAREPAYRSMFDRCCELFDQRLGCDLRGLLVEANEQDAAVRLQRPALNFAAIVSTELAVAALLDSFGVRPTALLGNSLGEYTAAHIAGVLSLPDVIGLVAARGQLCDDLPPAALVAVPLAHDDVRPLLGDALSLAVISGVRSCAVSGPLADIEEFTRRLHRDGVKVTRLPLSMAPHSAAMDPIADAFFQECTRYRYESPSIPMISGLTGTWITASETPDPQYWTRHLRDTMRFYDGLSTLLADPDRIILEAGPGQTLTQLTHLHPACGQHRVALPTVIPGQSESRTVASILAKLWESGVDIDWRGGRHGRPQRRVPLPTYPFAHKAAEALPAPTAPAAAAQTVPAGPDRTEEVLRRIWCEVTGLAQVQDSDDFFRSGGDSHLAVVLRSRIREQLGVQISAHALLEQPTFGALARHLKPATVASPLMLTLRRGGTEQAPLYLVQALGGTVYSYRQLAEHLDAGRAVHAFRAYGLEPGETALPTIEAIAALNVRTLLDSHPGGPIIVGGHSSGGLIAHEMAGQLLAAGHRVPLVVLIDTSSISDSHRLDLRSVDDIRATFDQFRDTAPDTWQAFRTAIDVDENIRTVIVATNNAIRTHEPAELPTDLLFVRAQERNKILDPHPEIEWKTRFTGNVSVRTLPGNHFTIMDIPHVAQVGTAIEHALNEIRTEEPSPTHIGAETPSGIKITGLTVAQAAEFARLAGGLRLPPIFRTQ